MLQPSGTGSRRPVHHSNQERSAVVEKLIISTPLVVFSGRSLYIWIGDAKSKKKLSSAISEAILPKFGTLIADDNV